MPVDRTAALQLGLLLLAVPAQFFLSKYYANSTESQRVYALKTIVSSAVGFKNKYLSVKSWQKWCVELVNRVKMKQSVKFKDTGDPGGESPAVEVMQYRDPKGHFAGSPEPRSPRSPEVRFRVGQVVRHKKWGYRGVIVGWDPQARAPELWLKQMHPPDKPHWRTQPNYSILVDTRDRLVPQATYVPQENIEILSNTQIIHPSTDDYFEGWDGAQYLPRPALKSLYPHD